MDVWGRSYCLIILITRMSQIILSICPNSHDLLFVIVVIGCESLDVVSILFPTDSKQSIELISRTEIKSGS